MNYTKVIRQTEGYFTSSLTFRFDQFHLYVDFIFLCIHNPGCKVRQDLGGQWGHDKIPGHHVNFTGGTLAILFRLFHSNM